jgi:hypothetical protein
MPSANATVLANAISAAVIRSHFFIDASTIRLLSVRSETNSCEALNCAAPPPLLRDSSTSLVLLLVAA